MTVSIQTTRTIVQGNGATRTFSYSFPIPDAASARLYLTNLTTGSILPIGTAGFSITGIGSASGGTFTYPVSLDVPPITSEYTLTLAREAPAVQTTALGNQSAYYASIVERAFDYMTLLIQQVVDGISRSVRVPPNENGGSALLLPSLETRRNKSAAWGSSGEFIALDPTDVSGEIVTSQGSTTGRALTERFAEVANVLDFGAAGDGVTDDGPAIQAALDTGRAFVYLPGAATGRTYRSAQTLFYRRPCQVIYGEGQRSAGGTRILFDTTVDPFFTCDSDTAGVTLHDCMLRGLLVTTPSYNGALGVRLIRAQGFHIQDVIMTNVNRGVDSTSSRICTFERFTCSVRRTGGYCVRLFGTEADAGGVAFFIECRWDATENGRGPAGLGQEADGLVLEGAAATITIIGLQVVRPRRGFVCLQGTEGLGFARNPYFVFAFDYEADNIGECGVYMENAASVHFTNSWLQGGYTSFTGGPAGASFYAGPNTTNITFNGYQGGHAYNGFYIDGTDVEIRPDMIGRNSATRSGTAGPGYPPYVPTTANTYDNIVLGPNSVRPRITGGKVGRTENGGSLARYGIRTVTGCQDPIAHGVDLTGNQTAAISDPDRLLTIAACRGTGTGLGVIVGVDGASSEIPAFGNFGYAHFRAGGATAPGGPIVNLLRAVGGEAGGAVQLAAEGADANVDLQLTPKGGSGRVRYGAFVATPVVPNGHVEFKLASGVVAYMPVYVP